MHAFLNPLILAAAAAGICFSFYNICGRIAVGRGLHMLHLAAVIGILGGIWLTPGALEDIRRAGGGIPWLMVFLGALNGTGRYLGTIVWNKALRLGPLTPLACAINLGFIVTIPYVWLRHGQKSSAVHWAAVLLAIAAVILAAKANTEAGKISARLKGRPPVPDAKKIGLAYLLVLFLSWVAGGLGCVLIKEVDLLHAPGGRSYLEVYGNVFWVSEYFALGLLAGVDRLIARDAPVNWRLGFGLGVVAVTTALIGMEFLRLGITLHPAIYFSTSNVTAILFSVLVGAVAFRERRVMWWYLTAVVSVAVVLLANFGV